VDRNRVELERQKAKVKLRSREQVLLKCSGILSDLYFFVRRRVTTPDPLARFVSDCTTSRESLFS
jgi:hypothetical protein